MFAFVCEMGRLMVLTMVLLVCSWQGQAASNQSNIANYDKENLVFSSCNFIHICDKSDIKSCKSCNSVHVCDKSSTKCAGFSPFTRHEWQDGAILHLCLEPADQSSCKFSTSSGGNSYGGLEVMEIERKLIGYGSHRELRTSLTLQLEKGKQCHMVMVESLSSGVFADMFELEGLVLRGAYESAVIHGDHNLELPALHSSESIVVLQTSFTSESEHLFQEKVSLPLHARYPPLSLESHAVIKLKFPHFLFQCFDKEENALAANSDAGRTKMEGKAWALLDRGESNLSDLGELQWLVPAGNPGHFKIVAGITFCTSLGGVVMLWVVSKYSYDSQRTMFCRT